MLMADRFTRDSCRVEKKTSWDWPSPIAQMSPSMLSQASAAGLNGGSFESVAELSYSCVITPSVALQPDL